MTITAIARFTLMLECVILKKNDSGEKTLVKRLGEMILAPAAAGKSTKSVALEKKITLSIPT